MNKLKIGNKTVVMVPSGKMYVTTGEPRMLAASLGSCVGLALLDTQRKIGGLIHVLLPHSSSKVKEVKDICAQNALELLLQKMLEKGAKKESIVAGLCGGFCSDFPWLDQYSIESVKIIKQKLKEENIPLVYLEPIEHLTKSFVVNVEDATFSCKDIFLEEIRQRPDRKDECLKIEDVLFKIKPIPSVVTKIVELISQESFKINEIVEEVKKDEVITAKLIKTCNSPIFAPVKKIDSIEKAAIFLGSKNLLKILLSVYIEDFYDDSKGYSLQINGMYNHSLAVATISHRICEQIDIPRDVGYTCGLLHDIGKKVLDLCVDKNKAIYYKRVIKGEEPICIEKKLFGVTHCEIGEKLATRWNFPKNITRVIKNHHTVSTETDPMVKVVYLSNILAHHFFPGLIIGGNSIKEFDSIMNSLGLTYSALNKIMETIPYNMFSNGQK